MKLLIVNEDSDARIDLEIAFSKAGFEILSTGHQAIAESCIRRGVVDLLIMSERVGKRLTHSLSLLAECRNPMVETILMTPRTDPDIDELFLLLPSLHCIVDPDVAPEVIIKLAMAAIKGAENRSAPFVLTSTYQIRSPVVAHMTSVAERLQTTPLPELEMFG